MSSRYGEAGPTDSVGREDALRGGRRDRGQSCGLASPESTRRRVIWSAVDRLIDRTPDVTALRANRLHLLAARRWRELGRPIPPDLEDAER